MTAEAVIREDGARWLRVSEQHQSGEIQWSWLCEPENGSDSCMTRCDADGWIDAKDKDLREPPGKLVITAQLNDGSRSMGEACGFVWDDVAAWVPAMPFYDRHLARRRSASERT